MELLNESEFGVHLRQRHLFCNYEENVVFKNMKNKLFGSDNVG